MIFNIPKITAVFNRYNHIRQDGKCGVQIKLSNRQHVKYINTGIYVKPECFVNGEIINDDNAETYNKILSNIISSFYSLINEFTQQNKETTLNALIRAIKDNRTVSAKLTEFGRSFIQNSDKKERTKSGYETLFNNIEKFNKDITIADVDYNFITKYNTWLKNNDIAHNTRVGRLHQLKALLNEAIKQDIIQKNPFDKFKIQSMESKKGFLSKSSIEKLKKLNLPKRQQVIIDAFLFCVGSGLRFSDFKSLNSSCIKNGWLEKKMIKTNFNVSIPIAELFDGLSMKIIEKYGRIENLVKRVGCNATANKILHEVFEKHNITMTEDGKKATFHTARHTFASLLLQNGMPITTVQKLLGHQKLSTTEIYAEVNKQTITNDIKKIIKKNKKNKFINMSS